MEEPGIRHQPQLMKMVPTAPQHQPRFAVWESGGGCSPAWERARPHVPARDVHPRKSEGRKMDGEAALLVEPVPSKGGKQGI